MKVFVMWSGNQSRKVAEKLREFLRAVIQRPRYFISTEDIESGAVWESILAGELENTHIGIACLTASNLESRWIHFEAGAVSKVTNHSVVIPYLIGLNPTDVSGPLTKFQFVNADRNGTFGMVETINRLLPEEEQTPTDAVKTVFDALWPELEKQINDSRENTRESKEEIRPTDDILREILQRLRAIERKEIVGNPEGVADRGTIGLGSSSYKNFSDVHVLWVDDNPHNNEDVSRLLERSGAKVTIATSTSQALQYLEGDEPSNFQLLVTDMARPEGQEAGIDILDKARKLGYYGPAIVFSTSSNSAEHQAILKTLNVVGPVVGFSKLLEAIRDIFR